MKAYTFEDPNLVFFTSDTHFNHFNICKYCHRPFTSRSEMNEALIDNWNSKVPENGIVIHCGDFMLAKDTKEYFPFLKKLNGNIILVRGNHDVIDLGLYNDYHLAVHDKVIIFCDGVTIEANHEPLMAYPANYNVFGHIHTLADGTCYGLDGDVNSKLCPTQYDVGVDQNNYTPLSWWDLADIFRNRAYLDH